MEFKKEIELIHGEVGIIVITKSHKDGSKKETYGSILNKILTNKSQQN